MDRRTIPARTSTRCMLGDEELGQPDKKVIVNEEKKQAVDGQATPVKEDKCSGNGTYGFLETQHLS